MIFDSASAIMASTESGGSVPDMPIPPGRSELPREGGTGSGSCARGGGDG